MRARWWMVGMGCLAQCGSGGRPPAVGTVGFDAGTTLAPIPCMFTGVVCDGQTPYRCSATHVREYLASCGAATPFCVGGGCVACPPASVRCDPDHPATPQQCAADGSGWASQAACNEAGGERCTDGHCGDPCAVPDGSRGYLGCEYWATETPNSQLDPAFSFAVALSNPQTYAVTVRISGGGLTAPLTEQLAPGAVQAVPLPWVRALVQNSLDNHGCPPNTNCRGFPPATTAMAVGGAYHIQSTAPVAAYQFNPLTFERIEGGVHFNSYTNDASLLLAQRSLTSRYIVLTAPNWVPEPGTVVGGFIAVTATTGETTSVDIQLPSRGGVAGMTTVHRDNLTPGDVFVLVGDEAGDLSGALVTSSLPVAVFAGHDCTDVPATRPACDHLEEQVFPLETLGRDFLVTPLIDRPGSISVVRVVSPFDGAEIRFDPPNVANTATLNAQEVLEVQPSVPFRLTSTRPVLVAQLMVGQGQVRGAAGDPAMLYEVPSQQFRDRYDVLVPDTYTSNFFGLVVPHGATALIDGTALTAARTTIGAWDLISTPVMPGAHQLRTAEGVPLGVKIYGVATYTSYMYTGGLDLQLLPPG